MTYRSYPVSAAACRIPQLPVRAPAGLRHQRGFSFALVVVLLSLAVGAAFLSFRNPATLSLEQNQKTADDLARVKEALIGYAVQRGTQAGTARPGEFPCPDTKLATDPNYGTEDLACVAGALGRLPWKTLGIAEPKDTAGETLWYAVAGPFRRRDAPVPPNLGIINSDTRGNMIVYATDGVTQVTNEAVAVIIAPGPVTPGQSRSGGAAVLCAVTGTLLAPQLCAANYLDAMADRNNATINGPFIAGQPNSNSPNFNDRLLFITAADVMPAIEMRVANELRRLLEGYRAASACKCYPWPATWNITLATAGLPSYTTKSTKGLNRGRFPTRNAKPRKWSTAGTTPPPGSIPALPLWFTYNNWNTVIYYSVAKQNTNGGGSQCTTCGALPTLSVDGAAVSVLFFMPGSPAPGAVRPSNTLASYLDDAPNNDGTNDIYAMPAANRRDRDRLITATVAASLPADAEDDDADD